MGMLVLSFVVYWAVVNISGWVSAVTGFSGEGRVACALLCGAFLVTMGFPCLRVADFNRSLMLEDVGPLSPPSRRLLSPPQESLVEWPAADLFFRG